MVIRGNAYRDSDEKREGIDRDREQQPAEKTISKYRGDKASESPWFGNAAIIYGLGRDAAKKPFLHDDRRNRTGTEEPSLHRPVISGMAEKEKAQALRDLLRLAKQLRTSATATDNREFVPLFLRAARALEERASRLAFGSVEAIPSEDDPALHAPVDLRC